MNPDHMEVVTPAENTRRGFSPAMLNARKTACVHGHPFEGRNVVLTYRGYRECRICRNNRLTKYRRNLAAMKDETA